MFFRTLIVSCRVRHYRKEREREDNVTGQAQALFAGRLCGSQMRVEVWAHTKMLWKEPLSPARRPS